MELLLSRWLGRVSKLGALRTCEIKLFWTAKSALQKVLICSFAKPPFHLQSPPHWTCGANNSTKQSVKRRKETPTQEPSGDQVDLAPRGNDLRKCVPSQDFFDFGTFLAMLINLCKILSAYISYYHRLPKKFPRGSVQDWVGLWGSWQDSKVYMPSWTTMIYS